MVHWAMTYSQIWLRQKAISPVTKETADREDEEEEEVEEEEWKNKAKWKV